MYKVLAILVVLCGISAGYSVPARNAFMYYQQPMAYMGQRQAMYGFHYQNQQLKNQRRSAGVSAFAAGETMATGTFLKDCHNTDAESAELPAQDDQNVQTVAEAIPAEQYPVEEETLNEIPAVNDQEAEEPIADESAAIAPVAPAASVPEKKKKKVTPVPVADSAEEDEEVTVNRRRGSGQAATAPNAYFPINFGSTNGGAIAIANSYSTGKSGSASSTATAYGSPAAAELRRVAPAAGQLRRKPAKLQSKQKH